MLIDLRMAARTLRGAPGFTAIAAVSIGLGIGANVTIFGIVNSFFLRPLPVASPGELVAVFSRAEGRRWGNLSYPDVVSLGEGSRSLSGLVAFTVPGLRVSLRDAVTGAEAVPAAFVTTDYFDVLGLLPLRGRTFDAMDEVARGPGSVVIGERLWRDRFGGDASVIGGEVWLNRQPFRVVGVIPKEFTGTFANLATDVWLPLSRHGAVLGGPDSMGRRDSRFLNAIGRVRPGVSRAVVYAELAATARGLEASFPETNRGLGVSVAPVTGVPVFIQGLVGGFIGLLMGMVVLVLVVACANVAGLLLARATARSREVAIRASLGATRWRIIRQLLVEALLLAMLGGVLGLGVARVVTVLLLGLVPPIGLPLALNLSMDVRVVIFAFLVSLATAVTFGLLPSLHAARTDLMRPLKESGPGGGQRSGALRATLLGAQIAFSVMLLVAAGLLVRGLHHAAATDLGFDPSRIALFATEPVMLGYDHVRAVALVRAQEERASRIPGVEAAAAARFIPLGPRGDAVPVVMRRGAATDTTAIAYNVIDGGWLATLGVPLLRGRDFSGNDDSSSEGVAIINETMARRIWPDADALGQRFEVRGSTFQVVGVTRNMKYGTPGEAPRAFVHFALAQEPMLHIPPGEIVLHVRAASPSMVIGPVRRALLALDPDLPVEPAMMTETTAFSLFPARFASRIVAACGLLALILASVGLYGIAAFAVVRRTREIGIRIALGARGRDVVRLILREGGRIALVGVVLGTLTAFATSQLLRGLLFGLPPTDLLTYTAVITVLLASVLVASWLPAHQATRIDPIVALRAE